MKANVLIDILKKENLDELFMLCQNLHFQLFFESDFLRIETKYDCYFIKIIDNYWFISSKNFKKKVKCNDAFIKKLLLMINSFENYRHLNNTSL